MKWKEAVDNKGVKKSSSKSEIKRRDSIKSTSSQTEIKRTSSSKSVPVRKDSIKSPNEFLAKVTCWQQRVDPEIEVNLDKNTGPPENTLVYQNKRDVSEGLCVSQTADLDNSIVLESKSAQVESSNL